MRKLVGALSVAAVVVAALIIGARHSTGRAGLPVHYETATLTGGCFWSLQEALRQIPGVIKTTVGYTGGTVSNPTYEMVAGGKTGHAEAVEVVFDPAKLSYEQLLTDFLTLRNPTRSPVGTGGSYRSAIFYHSEEQKQIAGYVKDEINQSGKWNSPVITEITRATPFFTAEEYHQDYLRKSSVARSCSLF
jgi:methionine-S-sulfoxide reductase